MNGSQVMALVCALAVMLFVYAVLDTIYIALYAKPQMERIVSYVTNDKMRVRMLPVFLFYILGTICLLAIAALFVANVPQASLLSMAGVGLAAGLFAYLAYDMTVLATFTGSLTESQQKVANTFAAVDVLWGGVATALVTVAGAATLRSLS